jgi:PKD repeat protein
MTTDTVVEMSGIEDLAVRTGGGNGCIYLQYTYACWAKNCDLSLGTTAHIGYVFPLMSVRPEVRHNYLHDTGVADRYGIHTRMVAGALVEDNIVNGHSTMLMVNGVSGSVYAYNYGTNLDQTSGFMVQGLLTHGGTPNMCLFEGNRTPQFGLDNQWNNSSYLVSFRNRHTGKDDLGIATGNMQAVAIMCTNRHASVIGCVLGKSGVNTYYQDDGTTGCHDGSRVFYLGLESGGQGCSGNYDPLVVSTLVRALNWTSATTTNNGIVSDGRPLSDLPNSYYLASKPANFGNLRWPPIDPSLPAYSDSQTNIPAGYRFVYGIDPPGSTSTNLPPVVAISASPRNALTNVNISFSSGGSVDPEGVTLTYSWDFGDGITSTQANPTHAYSSSGTKNVQLNVSDGVNTTTTNITVTITLAGVNQPPTASASATSSTSGTAPLTVAFSSAGSSDLEGTTLTYNWNFGDGTSSTAANPSKTFSNPGSYSVVLTVSDGTNNVAASPIAVTVGTGGTGLVAAYGFEEASGSTTSDASGKNNNGTISGASWVTSGRFGNALQFNGSSMVTVADSASLDLTTGMTLEAWVYPTALSATWTDIIYKDPDAYFLMGSTPQAQAPDLGGTFGQNVYGNALPLNSWSHIAGTYDGATMKFYVNVVLVGSRAQTGSISTTTGQLSIGGDPSSGQYWQGRIDEVRIYNRALSQTEVHNDMNVPVSGTASRPGIPAGFRVVGP